MIKRIESKKELAKKQKRNRFLLAGFLTIILVGSLFGILTQSFGESASEKKTFYNGYEFSYENGYYLLEAGENVFYFSYAPNESMKTTADVFLTKTLLNYSNQVVYVAFDNYDAYAEIAQNFGPFVSRIQGACVEGVCFDETLPAKTCEENVIVIKQSNQNRIYEKENCVFIEGKNEELLKLTDEFLLYQIGINK